MEPSQSYDALAEALGALARTLVAHPDHIAVTITPAGAPDRPPILVVTTHPADISRLLGKGQKTFQALVQLVTAWCGRHGLPALLEVHGAVRQPTRGGQTR